VVLYPKGYPLTCVGLCHIMRTNKEVSAIAVGDEEK